MEPTIVAESAPEPSPPTAMDQPIPMSFPSLLRAGRNPHLAYLQQERLRDKVAERTQKGTSRESKEGKRWVRRKENAHFSFNPHIIPPSAHDLSVAPSSARTTFPIPLPPYLPRSSPAPSIVLPLNDPGSTAAGHYTMSLRGVRKAMRRGGGRAETIVRMVDNELREWLTEPIIKPDANPIANVNHRQVGGHGPIFEISRTQAELVWNVEEDPFARYIVHATARFYGVVSFSKDHPGEGRLTHLLRPSVARPSAQAMSTMATPPITDLDSGSEIIISERETRSESSDIDSELGPLTEEEDWVTVPSENRRSRLANTGFAPSDEDTGPRDDSPHGLDANESGEDIATGLNSVSLNDTTPRATRRRPSERFNALRTPLRSGSSPSRSPARRYRSGRPMAFISTCTQDLRSFPSRPTRPTVPATFTEYLFG